MTPTDQPDLGARDAALDAFGCPRNGNGENRPALALTVPADFIERVAERVADLLAERGPAVEDGWLRGADTIAAYVGAPRSRVYALAACNPPRIPVHRDGSALIAKRSELDAWARSGGGKRP